MLDQLHHLIRSRTQACVIAEEDRFHCAQVEAKESHLQALKLLYRTQLRQEKEAMVYCLLLHLISLAKEQDDQS